MPFGGGGWGEDATPLPAPNYITLFLAERNPISVENFYFFHIGSTLHFPYDDTHFSGRFCCSPDGTRNYTQEDDNVVFLGATTDDCGDALVTTVLYYANSSENNFACTNSTQIGANAFQCTNTTSLSTTRGFLA